MLRFEHVRPLGDADDIEPAAATPQAPLLETITHRLHYLRGQTDAYEQIAELIAAAESQARESLDESQGQAGIVSE